LVADEIELSDHPSVRSVDEQVQVAEVVLCECFGERRNTANLLDSVGPRATCNDRARLRLRPAVLIVNQVSVPERLEVFEALLGQGWLALENARGVETEARLRAAKALEIVDDR